jgi:CheY-specific phosphatase CheX
MVSLLELPAAADAPGSATPPPAIEALLEILKQAVDEVFSTMAGSLYAAHLGEDPSTASQPGSDEGARLDSEAEVLFHGALLGSIVLHFSTEGALNVARGLLMLDEGETLEVAEVSDAIGECANMVAGCVRTRALDPQAAIAMSLPTVRLSPQDRPESERHGRLAYRLSQGHMAAEIWLAK